MQKAINCGGFQAGAGTYQPALFHELDQCRHCGPGHALSQGNQVFGRMLIDGPALCTILAILGVQRLKLAAALFILLDPAEHRTAADTGAARMGDLPLAGALVPQKPLLLSVIERRTADKLMDHPKPEHRNPFFSIFIHRNNLLFKFLTLIPHSILGHKRKLR
jgi:hypothetical protein